MGIEPAIDIAAEQRKTVLSLLEKHLPNTTAWVYGSRAKWTARSQSDLDMVVFATPEQSSQVFNLREAFEESNLPFRVDLFVWDDVPKRFRKRIEAEHVVLVERGERGAGDGWRTTTLGEVVTLQRGFDLPRTERKLGSYPVIASTGPVGTHDRAVIQGPGVVIGRSGSLGGGQFIKHDFWPLNTTLWVKDFNNNDPRFCYFFLKSLDLAQFNAGSGVPTLNRNHIHPLPVRVPPLPEQRAIAHILGTLDDKIELNRRMNETLEEMARALFKSWFVDFDPVRAKMEGRDTGLPPNVDALFPDRLVDSEVGEIPEGWEPRTLGECFDLTMGQSPPGSSYNDHGEGLPFFQGRTDFGFRYPENRKFCTSPTRKARPGDTLVSVRAPVGDINMAWTQCCIGRGVAALRHKSNSSSYTYYSVLELKKVISEYEHSGTVFGAINRKQFEALSTIEPRSELIEGFHTSVSSLDFSIEKNTLEIQTLADLRDTLLPRLISGEVRVENAETLLRRMP